MTIKILGVIDEDPFDKITWSGSSYYFFNALRSNGNLYDAISTLPSKKSQLIYKILNFQIGMDKWRFKYHLNTGLFNNMSEIANRKINEFDKSSFDVVLQIGAWYDLTNIKNKIFASYHDGNLATLLKSPYGYPNINRKHINKALKYEKKLYDKIDFIFPMSKWLADSFINDFGVNPNKIFPVGAGINLPHIEKIDRKDSDELKILFVGKDFDRKGGRVLLEAFASVRKKFKNAQLIIVGPEITDPPEGIVCKGFISKQTKEGIDQMLSLYSQSDIFVLPSLYEPFGIAFAEAMAHQLPCIGTNNCAMPEIIDEGKTGFLVEPNDSQALAGAINILLEDSALRHAMGTRAYEKYYSNYRWEVVTQKIVEVLSSNMGGLYSESVNLRQFS